MMNLKRFFPKPLFILLIVFCFPVFALAQDSPTILTGGELTRVVPPGFYFQGQSASTQIRNSAAVRFGTKRFVIAGMVDTSGYAADVRAKYEGFLISDSPIKINDRDLGTGAYGFGFSDAGNLQIYDIAGDKILSVSTTKDSGLRRPRPLMMMKSGNGVRLYSGKDYVTIMVR